MLKLRPYQQEAFEAVINQIKVDLSPCLIDAAPAAGKSFIIAAIANEIYRISKKKILCLAPSAELVKQNREKYLLTGEPASMFSATAGKKDLKHPVVFGTPMSVLNSINYFNDYAMVIIDEAHGLTPTIKKIITELKQTNPKVRVVGLSGTPYRLGEGYIYEIDEHGEAVQEAYKPYFHKLVYRVTAKQMLDGGYITPMEIGIVNASGYDTSSLVVERGQYTDESLHRTFEGQGRLTSQIVADVVDIAKNVYGGCMFFAATVKHAYEIMESLPAENSHVIIGDTKKTVRKDIIQAYREQRFKYLVSVGTLTTGFDVEHTSVIATLRKTMSVALLQQILGRAWRLDDGKPYALWLDYAENCEEHFPEGNIYNPVIKATKIDKEPVKIKAVCPECGHENAFTVNKDVSEFDYNENGYCIDENGLTIVIDENPVPIHLGRRCNGILPSTFERCSYRWTSKECEHCGHDNDITARYCKKCKHELVNPNEKLKRDFIKRKRDPHEVSTDKVISWSVLNTLSQAGNSMFKVTYVTEYNNIVAYYVYSKPNPNYICWKRYTNNGTIMPRTITYYKKVGSEFWSIIDYNREEDEIPE